MTQTLGPLQTEWIRRLRSGEYEQGDGCLERRAYGKVYFCCLGIACRVAIDSGVDVKLVNKGDYVEYEGGHAASLPREVMHDMKFRSGFGECVADQKDSLAILNDHHKTFSEIADIVCADPSLYFTEPA